METVISPAVSVAADAQKMAVRMPVDENRINKANTILEKYKAGKSNLDARIKANDLWYRMRHWELVDHTSNAIEPVSGWLFNSIANKHADAMDNFPRPNILPREEGDKAEAEALTAIVPVILDHADFEDAYSVEADRKLKCGTGVFAVLWDASKLNGLGDVTIRSVDVLKLFWQPGIADIQESKNLFYVTNEDNETLIARYPQLAGRTGNADKPTEYAHDDNVDDTDKSTVVDWYYKVNGVVHYCKYSCGVVLYSTENEGMDRGIYDHGLYPFVFDPLFRVEDSPAGFGYIDVGKSAQEYIDRANQAIMQNLLVNARPRYFIRGDGAVKEKEFADMTKDFIHVDGNLGQDSILPVSGQTLPGTYVTILSDKINELKETTGNRDVQQGGTSGGVTAASAIAAMQEAGSKLSRDYNKASYRAFRKLVLMVIELIRQFYDLPRRFRILGENGSVRYIQYTNANIKPQSQGVDFGQDMGMRQPLFDVEITAEKASPYSRMSQNEMALSLYQAGMFAPQMSDQALLCLDMMDFDRKDFIMEKIAQNGMLYQQLMQMQQTVGAMAARMDAATGGTEGAAIVQSMSGEQPEAQPKQSEPKKESAESPVTENARRRVAESTSV